MRVANKGCFIVENFIKVDDLRVSPFMQTSILSYFNPNETSVPWSFNRIPQADAEQLCWAGAQRGKRLGPGMETTVLGMEAIT